MPKHTDRHLTTIVFDFDGTLARLNIDFADMRRRILDLIARFNIPSDNLDNLFALEMVEAGRRNIAQVFPGNERNFVDQAYTLIRDIEMEGAMGGELFSGVEAMLKNLRDHQIKIGVVTRNCIEAVTHLYPEIQTTCDAVITREATKNVKPHPEQLLIALTALDTEPRAAAMVGDHPMDITIGKDVGTFTIGVLTGYAHEALLREAGADLILEAATEVTELV